MTRLKDEFVDQETVAAVLVALKKLQDQPRAFTIGSLQIEVTPYMVGELLDFFDTFRPLASGPNKTLECPNAVWSFFKELQNRFAPLFEESDNREIREREAA